MPRGGKRRGTPGTAYGNRTDLTTQAPSAAPGQTYGVAAAQLRAQQQVPLPKQAAPPPAAGGGAAGSSSPATPAAPPMTPPGALGPLDAPTQRPDEPITAGLNTGPGPGPEALGQGQLSPIDEIRAMYAANPSPDVLRLLQYLDGM